MFYIVTLKAYINKNSVDIHRKTKLHVMRNSPHGATNHCGVCYVNDIHYWRENNIPEQHLILASIQ